MAIIITVVAKVRAVWSRRMENEICDGGIESICQEKTIVLLVTKKYIDEIVSGKKIVQIVLLDKRSGLSIV